MERPDIGKPAFEPGGRKRLVARTQSIEEANEVAEQYQLQGYETEIIKRKQGTLSVYEVWIGKNDVFSGRLDGQNRVLRETATVCTLPAAVAAGRRCASCRIRP